MIDDETEEVLMIRKRRRLELKMRLKKFSGELKIDEG